MTPVVTNVRFVPASQIDGEQGLLGWCRVELGGVLGIDGVVIRRSIHGATRAFLPERIDRAGRRHRVVEVLDRDVERAVEKAILAALREQGMLP